MNIVGRAVAAILVGACSVGPSAAADLAWVARTNGSPRVSRSGSRISLQRGDPVQVGDVIETDAASKVKILLADDSILDLGPNSRVTLDAFALTAETRRLRLNVLAGRFKLAVARLFGPRTDCEVRTQTALAGVRGTVLWGDTDRDTICALDGRIEVRALTSHASATQVSAGHCVQRMAAGETVPLTPTAAELAAYLKEVTLD